MIHGVDSRIAKYQPIVWVSQQLIYIGKPQAQKENTSQVHTIAVTLLLNWSNQTLYGQPRVYWHASSWYNYPDLALPNYHHVDIEELLSNSFCLVCLPAGPRYIMFVSALFVYTAMVSVYWSFNEVMGPSSRSVRKDHIVKAINI